MNKIEKLIKELCPNGVEWKKLGEVCGISTGKGITKKDEVLNGKYPIISGGITPMGYYNSFNRNANTITVSRVGANAGYVNFITCNFYLNDKCFSVIPIDEKNGNINVVYLYHYLKYIENNISELQSEGGVPTINTTKLSSISIPLPPLPIQTEIVRILDKFVEQQEQLERLIELRKKQYEYYREEMLKPKEGEKWETKTLGEIGTFVRGNGLQKTDFREEGFPCIHYGQVHTYYGFSATETKSFCSETLAEKLKKASYGDLIIATTSEDVDACCKATVWLGKGKVAISGDSYLFSHNKNPKFVAHLFRTKRFADQKRMVATGAKVVRVSGESMAKFEFQIPSSLDRQKEIADALDRFELSLSSLISALEATKARYEYYRDLMLNF